MEDAPIGYSLFRWMEMSFAGIQDMAFRVVMHLYSLCLVLKALGQIYELFWETREQ